MTNLINPSNIASEEETLFGQRVKNKFLKAYVRMTPELMQELINKAQAGDQEALDRLCRQFKPAVEATAKSPTCAEVLGKDAVSCAWLVFIQLILKTKKPVTVYFPGYIKKVLCRVNTSVVDQDINLSVFLNNLINYYRNIFGN